LAESGALALDVRDQRRDRRLGCGEGNACGAETRSGARSASPVRYIGPPNAITTRSVAA